MRFYAHSKTARILWTLAWVISSALLVFFARHSPWFLAVLLVNPLIQGVNLWANYWEITPAAFTQHGIFFERQILPTDLRYAGPYRRPGRWVRRWARRGVELDAGGANSQVFVSAADRTLFLQTLADYAPRAEVVMQDQSG